MAGPLWIKSAEGNSVLNLDHVVSLAVERDGDGNSSTYRVVAITVLGSAISVATGIATAKQAEGWVDDYLTTLAMTASTGSVEDPHV